MRLADREIALVLDLIKRAPCVARAPACGRARFWGRQAREGGSVGLVLANCPPLTPLPTPTTHPHSPHVRVRVCSRRALHAQTRCALLPCWFHFVSAPAPLFPMARSWLRDRRHHARGLFSRHRHARPTSCLLTAGTLSSSRSLSQKARVWGGARVTFPFDSLDASEPLFTF